MFALVLAYVVLLTSYFFSSRLLSIEEWWIDLLDTFALYLFVPVLPLLLLASLLRSWQAVLLCVFPLALFALLYGQLFVPHSKTEVETATTFKVMTYNILGMNRSFRNILDLVDRENPDVVAIQELTPEIAAPLISGLSGKYQYRALAARADFNGVGVFSRFPIKQWDNFKTSETGSISEHLILEVHGRDVHLFNVHPKHPHVGWIRRQTFPPYSITRFAAEAQMVELEYLMDKVEAVDGPIIALGDFNLTDQTRHYRRITRTLMDAYREAGWGLGFTFPANGRVVTVPSPYPVVRIDYVFHSRDLVPLEAHLGDQAGSDHFPVIAELAFQSER